MADLVLNVIERVREQLRVQGKMRGFKKPLYEPKTKRLKGYAVQWVEMLSADVLELCAMARANGTDTAIVRALEMGHQAAISNGCTGRGTNQADDIFHLLDCAGPKSSAK